jgi:hypothetical protein
VALILPTTAALALASCGGASSSTNARPSSTTNARPTGSTAAGTATAAPTTPTDKVAAAVQSNIQGTLLTDAKVTCPSQPLPGNGHSIECQLTSHLASGSLTLTQRDTTGKCFLYTGKAGPYSWTAANNNVVCVQ